MNHTSRKTALLACAVVATLGLGACGAANETANADDKSAPGSGTTSGTLNGAGSSAQDAAQGAWAQGFQRNNPKATVNYDPIGSGGGVEQFLAGGVSFAGTDAYLTGEQLAASKKVCGGQTALEVPDYISPIAIAYNLDGFDDLQLSPETLAGIMEGRIAMWDAPEITADNPGAKLPGARITPVHRSDKSGTTKNVTDYLNKASNGAWPTAAEEWPFDSGEGAQGTSGVVSAISNGKGTIGYADASQLGNLPAAAVKVGDEYVKPSAESAAKVVDVSPAVKGRNENDMAVDLARQTSTSGAYPIVLVSYLVACPTYSDEETAELVKDYLSHVVSDEGQSAAARSAGSAPLSKQLNAEAAKHVDEIAAKG